MCWKQLKRLSVKEMDNILRLLAAIIVFVLVLAATYYVTKWIAKTGALQPYARNIKVMESSKIAPNKYIQIVKIGRKYYSIGVTKETITFLSELDEEQLDLQEPQANETNETFRMIWDKVAGTIKNKQKKE